jgi:hypothetical protein
VVVKLLDYRVGIAALEVNPNPFAAVVLAHLKTQETRQDPFARKDWKIRIVKGLYERGWSAGDVRQLWRFIDWMMDLPKGLEEQVRQEIHQYEEEEKMPYIDSATRWGMEQGLREGLLAGIEPLLRIKFPVDASRLMAEIRQITAVEKLREIPAAVETAVTADELRRVWSS